MSMKFAHTLSSNNPWNSILSHENEAALIEHDTHMLAFKFLGEIQSCQEALGINRKELAKKIGTSASYITQLYRGDKLPNLEILTRMAQALGLEFNIQAKAKNGEAFIHCNEEEFMKSIKKIRLPGNAVWVRRSIVKPENVYESGMEGLKNFNSDEIKAIPA